MDVQKREPKSEKINPDLKVVEELDARIKNDPNDAEAWFLKGQEYFGFDFNVAVDCFSRAISICPFNDEYYWSRGRKYVSLDQWNRALSDFIMALRIDPFGGLKWHFAGVCYFYLEDYDSAISYFKRAIEDHKAGGVDLLWPEVDWIWMSYMRSGRPEEAKAALDLVEDDAPIAQTDYFYKKRVELYKGIVTAKEYEDKLDRHCQLDELTELYGLANYFYYIAKDPEEAERIIDEILAIPKYHHAFGYKSAIINKRERA